MPEGPEIRIAADRIARVLEGERVEQVFFAGIGNDLRSEILCFAGLAA